MSHGETVLNGIRPDGSYAYTRPDDAEIAERIDPAKFIPPSGLRHLPFDVKPESLASAGWAVIYPPGEKPRYEPLLRDLLDLRRDQAGEDLFQSITLEPKETCDYFLKRFRSTAGTIDPEKLPYYLLLVGDPSEISFELQGRLDQSYAVGRLCFDRDEDYRTYAAAVREVEKNPLRKPMRRITLFGARNGDDIATGRTTDRLIAPLAEEIEKRLRLHPGWRLEQIVGPEARRDALADLMTGDDPPDVLFTASHGMVFPMDDPRQKKLQGALLCSDWNGRERPVPRDHYLAAEDLQLKGRPLRGSITFHLACHGGGTPEWDTFAQAEGQPPRRLTDRPFVAALPKRLLADGGALAVISHADRAWTTSFDWDPEDENPDPQVFWNTLLPLLHGLPVGFATESLGASYGMFAANTKEHRDRMLSAPLGRVPLGRAPADPRRAARLWRATNDIRGFVLYGDPAVRVGGWANTSR